eukprot:1453308-Prymnesium_polylepis.1
MAMPASRSRWGSCAGHPVSPKQCTLHNLDRRDILASRCTSSPTRHATRRQPLRCTLLHFAAAELRRAQQPSPYQRTPRPRA